MITKINVEGFKLHASTSIETKPITIFIGPNNSGKSSLTQAVQLLCQTSPSDNTFIPAVKRLKESTGYLYYPATYKIDVGGFEEVIRKGSESICIRLAGKISEIELEFEVKIKDNQLLAHKGRLKNLKVSKEEILKWEYKIGYDDKEIRKVCWIVKPRGDFQLIQPIRMTREGEEQDIGNPPENLLKSCYFIYPLRGFEEAGYLLPEQPPRNYSTLENVTLNDRIVALIATFAYNPNLRKEVAEKLSDIMGYKYNIDIQWIGSNRVRILLKQPLNTLMVNEGSGFQQMVFILLPLILIPDNSTVFIQEPEAHLHPKAQVELGRLLIKFFEKKNIQLFIETHSEHILHAFLHSIAKQQLSKDNLAVYYFENIEGETKVRLEEIDELGRVKGGFPGFFDQSLNESIELIEAISTRK